MELLSAAVVVSRCEHLRHSAVELFGTHPNTTDPTSLNFASAHGGCCAAIRALACTVVVLLATVCALLSLLVRERGSAKILQNDKQCEVPVRKGTHARLSATASAGAPVRRCKDTGTCTISLPAIAGFDDIDSLELIGAGGFGNVYKAKWQNQEIALKVGTQSYSAVSLDAARGLLLSILHPNLVSVYFMCVVQPHTKLLKGCGAVMSLPTGMATSKPLNGTKAADQSFTVMEYCDKGSLGEAVRHRLLMCERNGRIKPNLGAIYRCLLDIAHGMAHLHENNICHGDLKTSNVLLKSDTIDPRAFICKIADFGMSRILGPRGEETVSAQCGTFTHMAPEQLKEGKISFCSDVYSFGMIMWELYTGEPPWDGLGFGQVYGRVVVQQAQLPVPSGSPSYYASLMQRCWSADAARRPTFKEVVQALQSQFDVLRARKLAIMGSSGFAASAISRRSLDVLSRSQGRVCESKIDTTRSHCQARIPLTNRNSMPLLFDILDGAGDRTDGINAEVSSTCGQSGAAKLARSNTSQRSESLDVPAFSSSPFLCHEVPGS